MQQQTTFPSKVASHGITYLRHVAAPAAAVPLARALIHTKVPGWMDEEMPQGPPEQGGAPLSANMQRFRWGAWAWLVC